MEKLVTTSQAAKILNLSLQGVHYRIKNNTLKSIKQNGKTYVYINEDDYKEEKTTNEELPTLLELKDEQIKLLKKVVKWHKKQYQNELVRLQNAHNDLKDVMKSEIKLLQDAFSEMKKIYQNRIVDKKSFESIEYVSLNDFILLVEKYRLDIKNIKNLIIKEIKQKNKKFIYNKVTKEVLIHKSYFLELL